MNKDANPEASLENSIGHTQGPRGPFFFFFALLEMESRAFHMLGKLSTTEP